MRYKDTAEKANELRAEVPPAGTADFYKQKPHFRFIEQTRHERFAALYDAVSARSHILRDDQAAELVSAIRALDNTTEHMCSDQVISLLHPLCVWPCKVSKGFVDMLVNGKLFTLAIYAHFLILVVLAEDTWFMGDMGRAGILEIIDMCNAEPAADVERSLLVWPRQMLDGVDRHR